MAGGSWISIRWIGIGEEEEEEEGERREVFVTGSRLYLVYICEIWIFFNIFFYCLGWIE